MKTTEQLQGLYPASVTPYNETGHVDGETLQRLMEHNMRQGAAGFFVGGSSGECFLLSEAERTQVFEAASAFAGKTNLFAHVGAVSTQEAVRYAKAAMNLGYDFPAAVPPFYYGFSAQEICRYYYDIAEAAGVPVLIYNFPAGTHRDFDLSNPAYVQLLRSGAILGIKQTSYNLYQLDRILQLNPDLVAFSGYDEVFAAAQAMGAIGAIGTSFNLFLPHVQQLLQLCRSGSREEAIDLQRRINNCLEVMFQIGLIPAVKTLLEEQGFSVGHPRRPLLPPSEEQRAHLRQVLAENQLTV